LQDQEFFRNFGGNHRCYYNQRLAPASAELFLRSESFLAGLNDSELEDVNAAIAPT
jgi:hypothetical protein